MLFRHRLGRIEFGRTTSNPQNRGLVFFAVSGCGIQFKSELQVAVRSLVIDQDNLHITFLALNVDFNSLCFDPLGLRSPPYGGIKFGYLFKMRDFCYYRLI